MSNAIVKPGIELALKHLANMKSLYPNTGDPDYDTAWVSGYNAALDDFMSIMNDYVDGDEIVVLEDHEQRLTALEETQSDVSDYFQRIDGSGK